jgi:hypothetical protein
VGVEPTANAAETADSHEKLLPGMAAQLAEIGASPAVGFSGLTRKQQVVLMEYLLTGNRTEAARRAGCSTPEADGSKILGNPKVAAVLAQMGREVAKDADQLIKRVSERSRALHADIENERAKPPGGTNEARLLKLCAQADRTDALLGTLLGKVAGVHVSGSVQHHHAAAGVVTIPEEALPVLAQMRREMLGTAPGGRN